MKKREITDAELLERNRMELVSEIARWFFIKENGCNDPFYADGSNMNLIRNHIFYFKREIRELCEKLEVELPEEYYMPTPPEVDENYMANLRQKERIKRIVEVDGRISTKKIPFNDKQAELF